MKYPYLLHSDQHAHNWSQFGSIGADGINTRLALILAETKNAYAALKARGGNLSVGAGDLFHVRGKIEPSVFNPTFETYRNIHAADAALTSLFIPGNHDLEGKDSSSLGNAMQQLATINGFEVAIGPVYRTGLLVIPWYQDLNHLRTTLKEWSEDLGDACDKTDVVIHAPVNGVIKGIPDHGLEAAELAAYGFRRVFSGHYHDHKELVEGKVWSIGATTHQTWNDPGTTAGFMLVYEDHVEHFESSAPKFVDLLGMDIEDEAGLALAVTGNYVRLKIEDVTDAEVNEWRRQIIDAGAKGAIVIATSKKGKEVSRTATTINASTTLEASVAEYVSNKLKPEHLADVQKLCGDLIAQARNDA